MTEPSAPTTNDPTPEPLTRCEITETLHRLPQGGTVSEPNLQAADHFYAKEKEKAKEEPALTAVALKEIASQNTTSCSVALSKAFHLKILTDNDLMQIASDLAHGNSKIAIMCGRDKELVYATILACLPLIRAGIAPFDCLNNITIIKRKVSFNASFQWSALKQLQAKGHYFSDLFLEEKEDKDEYKTCVRVVASDTNGRKYNGEWISADKALKAGYAGYKGKYKPHWLATPKQMASYRAISYFCKIFVPELFCGYSAEEQRDIN